LNFAEMMMRRLTLTGSTLRPQSDAAKAAIAHQVETNIWPLIAQGKFRVVIDSEYALTDAPAAHWRLESSGHIGKIVMKIPD
jgi:NADPH:quinone reductase-like Zn-dependent oxidoreductase